MNKGLGENLPLTSTTIIIDEERERPTAVITAAIVTTTHPRVLNRSLVAWDVAGAPDERLWWLL